MTTRQERELDDQYEQQNDIASGDAPAGNVQDNSYIAASGAKQTHIPVASDDAALENPGSAGDPNSDQQLGTLSSQEFPNGRHLRRFAHTLE